MDSDFITSKTWDELDKLDNLTLKNGEKVEVLVTGTRKRSIIYCHEGTAKERHSLR